MTGRVRSGWSFSADPFDGNDRYPVHGPETGACFDFALTAIGAAGEGLMSDPAIARAA
jgi:hypothetical protein